MAQTVDEIAEILSEMRLENENNAETFGKALRLISTRLESIFDENEISDILRLYISEIKKSIEDRHGMTLSKFDDINKNLEGIIKEENFRNFRTELGNFIQKIIDNSSNMRLLIILKKLKMY